MGKKKSMVLMTLLTIVIVVLCAITVFPSFSLPGTVKKWNPAVMQYDLGADLGGGYYTYYYPEGVISETEYKAKSAEEQAEYAKHGNLYLSKDEDDGIIGEDGKVTSSFEDAFAEVRDEIVSRYEQKGYSDFCVTVVDDYALRVQLPATDETEQKTSLENAQTVFALFAQTGGLSIQKDDAVIDELNEYEITDLIKSFEVKTKYEVAYIAVNLTSKGKTMIKDFVAESESDSSSSTLNIMLGDEATMKISASDHVSTKYEVKYPVANETEIGYAETFVILLNSALKSGGFDLQIRDVASAEVRTYAPVYGENTLLLLYIALAVVILALIVFAIVKMGKFGGVSAYLDLSYLIVTGLCFAFISGGVFEVHLGTVLVFLAGLVLVNVLQAHIYRAIKQEFMLGKTVEASVKGGYKHTLFGIVDIYAASLIASIALLIGGAGLHTLALQAILCVLTGAFCNLAWGRFINFTFLSACKDKYKYFRFVREDDDDE